MKNFNFKVLLMALMSIFLIQGLTIEETMAQKKSKAQIRKEKKAAKEAAAVAEMESIISARTFVFLAEKIASTNSDVNGNYNLRVDSDALSCNLPYTGKQDALAYSSAVEPLDFTSEKFTFKTGGSFEKGKEKLIEIRATPEQGTNYYDIVISIDRDYQATLSIRQRNGNPNTFYGYIEPIKKKKK